MLFVYGFVIGAIFAMVAIACTIIALPHLILKAWIKTEREAMIREQEALVTPPDE